MAKPCKIIKMGRAQFLTNLSNSAKIVKQAFIIPSNPFNPYPSPSLDSPKRPNMPRNTQKQHKVHEDLYYNFSRGAENKRGRFTVYAPTLKLSSPAIKNRVTPKWDLAGG